MAGPFALPESWEEAREGLVALLRPVTVPFDALRSDVLIAQRQVAPALHAVLAWDGPRFRGFVKDDHLRAWGVSASQAFGVALEALEPAPGLARRDDGLWSLDAGDGCEASRALLPGWLAAFRGRVKGTPIVGIPHARRILVAGSDDLDAVAALCRVCAREWRTEGDPISPVPYRAEGGRLAPWSADGAPLWVQYSARAAGHALLQREYRRLADLWEDDAPLVAYDVGAEAADASGLSPTFSYFRWKEGPPVRIPDADVVVLCGEDGRAGLAVPFAKVREVAPGCFTAEHAPLPVWRTVGWPSAPEIDRLRAHAWPADRLA